MWNFDIDKTIGTCKVMYWVLSCYFITIHWNKNIITCHNVPEQTQLLIKICIELKQIEGQKIAPKYKRIKLHKNKQKKTYYGNGSFF